MLLSETGTTDRATSGSQRPGTPALRASGPHPTPRIVVTPLQPSPPAAFPATLPPPPRPASPALWSCRRRKGEKGEKTSSLSRTRARHLLGVFAFVFVKTSF